MKYILFWEFCPEDFDKVIEKRQAFVKDREKHPDKYAEVLFKSHLIPGENKGFQIVEATSEQIFAGTAFWMGVLTLKFVPILEAAKVFESYLKSK